MNDPRRLSEEASSSLERDLLRAGEQDAPPAGAQERAAIALGLSAGVVGGAAGASGAAGSKGVAAAGVAKLVAIGCAIAVVAVAAVVWTRSSSAPHAPKAHADAPTAQAAASTPSSARTTQPEDAPQPLPVASGAPPPSADAPHKRSPPVTPSSAPSIADEIALLDRARAALSAGDARGALRLVDFHDAKFKGDTFALESSVLRIDALDALGRSAAALERADAFLAAHPNEPMSRHVRSVADRLRAAETNP